MASTTLRIFGSDNSGSDARGLTLPARTEGMTKETWEMLCFIEIHGGIARAKRILMGLESGPMNARNNPPRTRKNAARLTR